MNQIKLQLKKTLIPDKKRIRSKTNCFCEIQNQVYFFCILFYVDTISQSNGFLSNIISVIKQTHKTHHDRLMSYNYIMLNNTDPPQPAYTDPTH